MNEPLFDIVFFGITKPDMDRAVVAENMASLFKTTPDKLKPYFAGGRKVIKSRVDDLTAEKYRVALEKAGLVIKIEPAAEAPEQPKPTATKPNQNTAADTGGLTVAEVGADVLREDEQTKVEPVPLGDISDISMADLGADVLNEDEQAKVEPAPIGDISDISMADLGADVLKEDEVKKAEPQPIGDISDLTIADLGADVLNEDEHVKAEPPPIDDISDISIAEPGADIIEHPVKKEKAQIDTSGIALAD